MASRAQSPAISRTSIRFMSAKAGKPGLLKGEKAEEAKVEEAKVEEESPFTFAKIKGYATTMRKYGMLGAGINNCVKFVEFAGIVAVLENVEPGAADKYLNECTAYIVEWSPAIGAYLEPVSLYLPGSFAGAMVLQYPSAILSTPLALYMTIKLGKRGFGVKLGVLLMLLSGLLYTGLFAFGLAHKLSRAEIPRHELSIAAELASLQRRGEAWSEDLHALQTNLCCLVLINSLVMGPEEEQRVRLNFKRGVYGQWRGDPRGMPPVDAVRHVVLASLTGRSLNTPAAQV